MARPRPVPPYRREIDASAWLNDWNRRPIRSGGMPMPVSRTSTVISQRSPGAASARSPVAGDGQLDLARAR